MNETALDRFVNEARTLFAGQPDAEKRWTSLGPVLAKLLADPAVIAASKTWPDCGIVEGRIENLLFYEDPDYKFVINGLILGAGDLSGATRIHDHGHIYTLYGLLDGQQRIERYERLDDRSKVDYAEIRRTSDSQCDPGEIDLVRPFEIHSEDTMGKRSVAVIIRSERSGGFMQGRYNVESGHYWEGLGPRQTPLAFYA
jgi:predicted metal-dependent enzyme (double-stranded beta helix superfamily)